jgi:CxxC motif-containing protein
MQTKQMTCIRCPIGCRMTVTVQREATTVSGNDCARGEKYARQEMFTPMRAVTSSVRVRGGVRPLCSVKTARDVPKAAIPDVLAAVHAARAEAPVRPGQVLVRDVGGTGVDLIATCGVDSINA